MNVRRENKRLSVIRAEKTFRITIRMVQLSGCDEIIGSGSRWMRKGVRWRQARDQSKNDVTRGSCSSSGFRLWKQGVAVKLGTVIGARMVTCTRAGCGACGGRTGVSRDGCVEY